MLTVIGCGRTGQSTREINVWHWMTDRQDAFEALAAQYEQQTGIKVTFSLFAPSDAYSQKVIAAAQANVLPDIYGILDKRAIAAAFIKEGYVADLTADLQADNGAWEKTFFPRALDNQRFVNDNVDQVKPGIYGIPLDVTSVQMVYNRNLLKKAGLVKAPATFDEFLVAVQALRRVGIAPFVTGFGEIWIVDCFAFNYAFNILGEARIMATFRGDVPYTDPDWVKVFTVFKTLAQKGAFMEGIVSKGNKYAEQDFALERAAFSFDGSWAVNIYKSMNPNLDYGVVPLPAMKAREAMRVWGGAGSTFVVNGQTPRKDEAVAFLKWMTAKSQQVFLAGKTNNLPANREAGVSLPTVLGDFSRAMEYSTHPSVWALNEDPLVVEVFDRGIQAIIIGEKTPEEVAREVQKMKARQLVKSRHR